MSATHYITTSEYVGPNARDAYGRRYRQTLTITTLAPRTNSSREIRTEGWLGTTNEWAAYAHGAFETLQEAEAAVAAGWQTYALPEEDEEYALLEDGVVAVYGIGASDPRAAWEAADWFSGAMRELREEIAADPSDEGLARLAERYEEYARGDGMEVMGVYDFLERERDDMQADADA